MKLRYRFEYCGNPDYVELHVTEKLTEDRYVSYSVEIGKETKSELLSLLMGTAGVTEASIRPYSCSAQRGSAFDRETVLKNLLETVVMWLKVSNGVQEIELEQLPTLRTDVRQHLCPECERIQQEEMKSAWRDIRSLDD